MLNSLPTAVLLEERLKFKLIYCIINGLLMNVSFIDWLVEEIDARSGCLLAILCLMLDVEYFFWFFEQSRLRC